MEWISVEDRLPGSGEHVLLRCVIRPSGKQYGRDFMIKDDLRREMEK